MSRISAAVPRRALAALVATSAAVVVMASFKTPDALPPRTAGLGGPASVPAPAAPPTAQGSVPPSAAAPTTTATATATPTAPPATPAPTPPPATAPPPTTAAGAPRTPVPTPRHTAPPPPPPTPRPLPTPTPVAASGLHDGSWTGSDVFAGQYGDVEVRLTISGGRITDVVALRMPSDRARSAQISQYAGPQLRGEVLQAQSAQIDTVSGATYTSDAYAQSVQAALDQAKA
ncbi:MAG TPA: FMN-binding protein [Candidatus Dormibacteraeota bacterium]|nr:FMN-binding protein [Candidatus Dormibacteraeota bacterium]